MKSPNLDLKQGIYYLVRKGEGGRERQREREKVRHKERGRERADNKNHGQRCVAQLVINNYIYDLNVQSNLCTTATLGTLKSGRLKEVPDKTEIYTGC